MTKLLSDQVDEKEISIIVRELKNVLELGVLGDVVEFGCYVGTTSVYLARILQNTDKEFYVYDSFEGLPEKTNEDESPLGEQFKAGELLATKKQFIKNLSRAGVPMPHIKKAWFNELDAADVPEKISFAFLDGDYFDSVNVSLKLIENNLASGAIVIVDDYSNEALPGAKKAVDGWLKNHRANLRVERSLAILHF